MPISSDDSTYEDQFDPLQRRLWRVWRIARWELKGLLGHRRDILVETRWRLGDEIMAIPIYEALRQQHPNSRIGALCNYPELIEGNPFVDAINDAAVTPDKYVLLRGASRFVRRIEHYAAGAGVPTPRHRPRLYYNDWDSPQAVGLPRDFVAVSSGASWATKRWPIERWRELCRQLEARGHPVVELGHGDEPIGVGISLIDRTTIRDAACVLHAARLLICCDSGLMHLGLAAGTPVLALFGPTDPTILIGDDPDFHVITSGGECQGCWNKEAGSWRPGTCPKDEAVCLESVTTEQVRTRACELLEAGG